MAKIWNLPTPVRLGLATAAVTLLAFASPAAAAEREFGPDGGGAALASLIGGGAVKGGDRIRLAPGEYGVLTVKGARFDPPLEIVSGTSGGALFREIRIHDSEGLTLRGFRLRPDPAKDTPEWDPLVRVSADSARVVIEDFDVRSAEDATSWTAEDWRSRVRGGLWIESADSVVRDSRVGVVRHGIQASGPRAVIENNLVEDFSADGLRALGDDSVVRGNTVRNCYDVDDQHHDGFQSWSLGPNGRSGGGVVRGVVVSGNRIFEWTRPESSPIRCESLQGIGLFDGVYEDWTIENNLVVVSSWHGISVFGGRNVQVVNNTVVNPKDDPKRRPRIQFAAHKDGRAFDGNIVVNNIATTYVLTPDVAAQRNVEAPRPARRFVRPQAFDYRPKPGGLEPNLADPAWQPPTDIDGRPRPASGGDLGAVQR